MVLHLLFTGPNHRQQQGIEIKDWLTSPLADKIMNKLQ